MARDKLPDRRPIITSHVIYEGDGGKEVRLLVSFGFERSTGRIREVFCADYKAGTERHSLVIDSCVMLSRLFQHGDYPSEISKSLCCPPSLIGAIAMATYKLEREISEGLISVPIDETTRATEEKTS